MKLRTVLITILIAVVLTACGGTTNATLAVPTVDIAAIRTSAASTVVSQFTLTAAAFTVTPAPPTETETPAGTATETTPPVAQVTNAQGTTVALCDKYSWDLTTVDVNVPDNTVMTPGQEFTKTWKIKNTGSCTWGAGYTMVYSYGDDKMSGQPQPFGAAIAPGQEVEVSVQFKAPDLPGTYTSYWTLQNPKGIAFQGNDGKVLYVRIIVQ